MNRYARDPDLRITALDGDGVVLHLGTRRYYSVSATGLDLLVAMETPQTIAQLITVLLMKYDVTGADAETAIRLFIEEGQRSGLLTVEDT